MEIPNIPMTKNIAIAVNLDLKKKKEHVIIGEFSSINRYIRGGEKNNIFYDKIRPIGSFLLDIVPKTIYLSDVRVNLCDSVYQKSRVNISDIESLYTEKNPLYKYLALRLWQEYMIAIDNAKNQDYDFFEKAEDLTLPFMLHLIDEVLQWQKITSLNPMINMSYEYFKYPIQTLLVLENMQTTEYAASDFSIFPIVVYYLKMIYEKNKYFSNCKVCGKLFLAPDVGKTVMCSEKCKKEQQKLNKQKYEEKAKELSYEQTYRNDSMYWRNRINKAKKLGANDNFIRKLEGKYSDFRKLSILIKKEVKLGERSHGEFATWLLLQRNVIDDLMYELEYKQ